VPHFIFLCFFMLLADIERMPLINSYLTEAIKHKIANIWKYGDNVDKLLNQYTYILISEAILLPGFNDFLTQRLLAQKGSVRVKPGSDRFRPIVHPLNLDPDLRFGSGNSLNLGPNLGPVQAGSGSNHGSEPDSGITTHH
jgi:hypothetical protein